MPLTTGTRLGAYEISSAIGAGGMGEVYRAHDARLGRDVAIKVLPQALLLDTDRLQRFEIEARATAALNHPNILAIYDIGQESGCPYLVSELLEGETLRVHLESGPIPPRRAIEWATQIARGLAAAHDKGIVHRDLKPDNLFVTADNQIKILDFGLAKAAAPAAAVSTMSVLPTTPPPGTEPGIVLGTIGYMSPEQVRGLPADARADIFALGAVLYEMLSGRRAFSGATPADTMTAILKEHPSDIATSNASIAPGIARVVERCLEKNPTARFQSASDLAFALESLSNSSSGPLSTAAREAVAAAPPPRSRWIGWATAGIALIVAAASVPFALAHLRETPPTQPPLARFPIEPPDGNVFAGAGGFSPSAAVSPDGRSIVFMAGRPNQQTSTLWVRSLERLDVRPLTGTEDGVFPFWSPDSKAIAFFASGKLKRVDIASGAAQVICDVVSGEGGTWNADNVIVFAKSGSEALSRVPAAGGKVETVTKLGTGESSHRWPHFLPDGRRFLFVVEPGSRVRLGSLDSPEQSAVVDTHSKALYVAPGYLLYVLNQRLMAHRFNLSTGKVVGDPVPIAEELRHNSANGRAAFSASDTGVLAYRTGALRNRLAQVTWFDRQGHVQPLFDLDDYRTLALSPDETRVAVHKHVNPSGGGILLGDLVRGGMSPFSAGNAHDNGAVWSPVGTRVAFSSNPDAALPSQLYENTPGRSAQPTLLLKTEVDKMPSSWVGDTLIFTTQTQTPTLDIWALSMTDRKAQAIVASPAAEFDGHLSPDGKWLAYVSNVSGHNEVYVQPFPDGLRISVSTTGGVMPRWRADGKELLYLTGGNGGDDRPANTAVPLQTTSVMSVDVEPAGATLKFSRPRVLFEGDLRVNRVPVLPAGTINSATQAFEVSKDGQKFLMLQQPPSSADPESPLTVMLNWTAALAK